MKITYNSPRDALLKSRSPVVIKRYASERSLQNGSLTVLPVHNLHPMYSELNSHSQRNSELKSMATKLPPIPSERKLKRTSTLIKLTQPKNAVLKCNYKSRRGSLNGVKKKDNQDNFLIKSNLLNIKGTYLFVVCDGHGEHGHFVSGFIKANLCDLLEQSLQKYPPSKALKKSMQSLDLLLDSTEIPSEFSGSTCVALLIIGDEIICANVGDSRGIIASRNKNWYLHPLSTDHKPENHIEAARILNSGGRIDSLGQLQQRVWLPNEDIPGLCMTRSIGDKACRAIGVISKPEIYKRKLMKYDKFIILASDGIWEFISNEEAVQIVLNSIETEKNEFCCQELVKEAVRRWKKDSESIDDITVLVIFLNIKYE